MRYLTIIPDYTGSCIKDDLTGRIDIEALELPQDFLDEISSWHESYKVIIPLSDEQRASRREEIEGLDNQGLELSQRLGNLVLGGAKVKYFSEGLMKYLPVKQTS